jgi:hypothetical protein
MSLKACDDLARWDTREQAEYIAEDLMDTYGSEWAVAQHHYHWHVISLEAVTKDKGELS